MEINEQYLRELLAQRQPPPKKRGSPFDLLFLLAVVGSLLFAIAVRGPELLVTYGVVSVETMCAILTVECPELAQTATPTPLRPTVPAPFGGGGGGSAPPSLPSCATVADTTTPCEGVPGALPQGAEQEPPQGEQATGTPEPRWVTETCLTPPGERPCWLPADQPWEPPASVPETPLVLLPQEGATWEGAPFVRDECADWHPPMAPIEGCP